MDCAPPHAGDGPCCSRSRRGAFTPTLAEEKKSLEAKNKSTQVGGQFGQGSDVSDPTQGQTHAESGREGGGRELAASQLQWGIRHTRQRCDTDLIRQKQVDRGRSRQLLKRIEMELQWREKVPMPVHTLHCTRVISPVFLSTLQAYEPRPCAPMPVSPAPVLPRLCMRVMCCWPKCWPPTMGALTRCLRRWLGRLACCILHSTFTGGLQVTGCGDSVIGEMHERARFRQLK